MVWASQTTAVDWPSLCVGWGVGCGVVASVDEGGRKGGVRREGKCKYDDEDDNGERRKREQGQEE